jgi:hypothetical protein
MDAQPYYNTGFYGQDIDVALIDSGVQPVKGLDRDSVVQGPDLSLEAQSPYAHLVPRYCAALPDREPQGRRRRRHHRCHAGDRGHRLGR